MNNMVFHKPPSLRTLNYIGHKGPNRAFYGDDKNVT